MCGEPKIRILDNTILRKKLWEIVIQTSQIDLAKWAINGAKQSLNYAPEQLNFGVINFCFQISELWQQDKASVLEVRKAGFKIHEEARKCKTEIGKNILRTVGQAVAVGHMKEHAIVCSDYSIKTIQLVSSSDLDRITAERQWQIDELKKK